MRAVALAFAFAALLAGESGAAPQKGTSGGSPLLPGGDAHAPVNINADKLEYSSKGQKALYSGHVVAKQGEGSMRSSTLAIFFSNSAQGSNTSSAPGGAEGSQVTHMEATGPVTIVQRDQVGVGDSASYDKAQNEVILVGNVSLTQGPNVVKGDRLIYDLTTGQSQVLGRVTSLFVPNNSSPDVAKPAAPGHKQRRPAPAEGRRF